MSDLHPTWSNPAGPILRAAGVAAAAVLAAAALRWSLSPVLGTEHPFLVFAAAVTWASYRDGVLSGAIAAVASYASAQFFFVEPVYSLQADAPTARTAASFLVFAATNGVIIWTAALLRRTETQLKAAKSESDRVRNQLETIVENIADSVLVFDPDGKVLYVNSPAVELLGFPSQAAAAGASLTELARLFEARDLEDAVVPFERWPAARAIRGETFSGTELRVRRTDIAHSFVGSFSASQVRDAGGERVMAVLTISDVTEQHRLVQRLRELNQELDNMVRERTAALTDAIAQLEALSYSLSHDLRAPLRNLRGYAHLILEEHGAALPADVRLMVERMAASAERLDQLTLSVLSYQRISRQPLTLARVELEEIVEETLQSYVDQTELEAATVEVIKPLPPVVGDATLLMQCVANLVNNALKFKRPGVKPRVVIRSGYVDDMVRLCVEDNGIGLPENGRDRLFNLFERLHGAGYPGTGAGLAIVRRTVGNMGGKVSVTSVEGSGSCFCLELPAAERATARSNESA